MPKLVKMNENTATEQLLRPSVIKISHLLLEKIEASFAEVAVIETKLQMDLMDAFIKISTFVLKLQEGMTRESISHNADAGDIGGSALTEEDIKILKMFVGAI